MYTEDDLLPLSALQHLMFCERQCALIHIEQIWVDNALTVEGSQLHRRVDEEPDESRGDLRIARSLPLRSLHLGLVGRADAVEFSRVHTENEGVGAATTLPGVEGRWCPFPVEYKRGRPKRDWSDEIQLCAQALCLEEMLDVSVSSGALFYGKRRRRNDVDFDDALRTETRRAAERLHELIKSGVTPSARKEPKCKRCSLLGVCLPDGLSLTRSATAYLDRQLDAAAAEHQTANERPGKSVL